MDSISFTSFPKKAANLTKMLPMIEYYRHQLQSVELSPLSSISPIEFKAFLLKLVDNWKNNTQNMISFSNLADSSITAFSKAGDLINGQATFMNRNIVLITVAMLTLCVSDTKYLNPESNSNKKLAYFRTALKTVGYVALASAFVLSLNARGQITSGLSELRPLARTIFEQCLELSAKCKLPSILVS